MGKFESINSIIQLENNNIIYSNNAFWNEIIRIKIITIIEIYSNSLNYFNFYKKTYKKK